MKIWLLTKWNIMDFKGVIDFIIEAAVKTVSPNKYSSLLI